MRRVRRITEQHDVFVPPGSVGDGDEIFPPGIVRQEDVFAQIAGEEALAVGDALGFFCLIQPGVPPGLLATLYDERAGLPVKRIGMSLE